MPTNSELVSQRRRKLKQMIVTYLGGKCARCEFDGHHAALVPHHVNEFKKSFALSMNGCTRSWKVIQEECKKCILLCQNCHHTVHATHEPYWFDENNIPDYGHYFDNTAHNGRTMFYCIDCKNECSFRSTRCRPCSSKFYSTRPNTQKIKWPDLEILQDLVSIHGYSAAGRLLGVSDNAIRKHFKTHSGVPERSGK